MKKGLGFGIKSANESESRSECSGYSDEEGNLGPEGSRTEEEAPLAKATKRDKMEQR